ncbi:MAG: hypothetical protein ACRD0L_04330 [Acidimicrobiales bacterium]
MLLVLMWVVVLTPALLRSRVQRRGDSIGSFRRQLGVIQRTSPAPIPLASRGTAVGASFPMPSSRSVADTSGQGVVSPFGPARRPGPGSPGSRGRFELVATGGRPGGAVAPSAPHRATDGRPGAPHRATDRAGTSRRQSAARARTMQRRRQVLVALAGTMAVTFLLGLVPSLRMLWWLTALAAVALVGYVALLVRLRNMAAEREMRVTFLPQPVDTGLLLRRSANY